MKQITVNIIWLFFDKLMRISIAIVTNVWLARYLGPEEFGILNYAIAFIGLFSVFASLGLQTIIVRNIVNDPSDTNFQLGTGITLQVTGGLCAFLVAVSLANFLHSDEDQTRVITLIIGATLLFKFTEVAAYWFESQVMSKYIVWIQTSVSLLFSIAKLFLIGLSAPLLAFAWLIVCEVVIVGLIWLSVLGRIGVNLRKLKIAKTHAIALLTDSWPLIISGFAVTVYMKIDLIMLEYFLGVESVGIYSVATRLSEIWYFIPMSVAASVLPALLIAHRKSQIDFEFKLQKQYDAIVGASLVVILVLITICDPLINLLYDQRFEGASLVLKIHVIGSIFVFVGVIGNSYTVVYGLQKIGLCYTLIGASINIIANNILIPVYHESGAAIATVLSQSVSGLFADLLRRETRNNFRMKLSAMNPVAIYYRWKAPRY